MTTSQILRTSGFVQFKTDCCLFGKYERVSKNAARLNPHWIVSETGNRLVCVIMLHVEDMIFTGTADSRNAFLSRISTLAHSPVQYLPLESDLAFCSVEIHLNKDRSIELSQRTFYSKLNDIQANDILQRDRFILNT